MPRSANHKGDGLYKDPRSPHWQIDKVIAGDRLRCSSGTADRAEAKAIVDAWVTERRRSLMLAKMGVKPITAEGEISLNDAVTKYFDEIGVRTKAADQQDQRL